MLKYMPKKAGLMRVRANKNLDDYNSHHGALSTPTEATFTNPVVSFLPSCLF